MEEETSKKNKINILNKVKEIYEKQYKKLLIIPFLILLLAIVQIGIQTATTGDFLNKGVSLKGGITLTIPTENTVDIANLQKELYSNFPKSDISVRSLSSAGTQIGVMIEADINTDDNEEVESFLSDVEKNLNLKREDYVTEIIGSSLGKSFFKEAFVALILAFIFMGIVVFLYFKTLAPSGAVILCAFSDIIVTLAVVNVIGMKLSTAGLAAFLMLIGYSVDTDIVLSTKMLKRKEGTIMERIFSATKTGLTMSVTTIIAVSVAIIFTQSEVIKQIMIIVLVGLLIDLINTWIQNVSILRLYLERKHKRVEHT